MYITPSAIIHEVAIGPAEFQRGPKATTTDNPMSTKQHVSR